LEKTVVYSLAPSGSPSVLGQGIVPHIPHYMPTGV